jgi:hypothetical protein
MYPTAKHSKFAANHNMSDTRPAPPQHTALAPTGTRAAGSVLISGVNGFSNTLSRLAPGRDQRYLNLTALFALDPADGGEVENAELQVDSKMIGHVQPIEL